MTLTIPQGLCPSLEVMVPRVNHWLHRKSGQSTPQEMHAERPDQGVSMHLSAARLRAAKLIPPIASAVNEHHQRTASPTLFTADIQW